MTIQTRPFNSSSFEIKILKTMQAYYYSVNKSTFPNNLLEEGSISA